MSYIIPFDAEVVISQGYNGPWSHKKIKDSLDQSYSLDFALPVGTEVLASRSGIVSLIWDRFDTFYEGSDFENGHKFWANFVNVLHDDGTIGNYQHFRHRGIFLKDGGEVRQGQPLGKTGLSGWIGHTPHLHFMVYRNVPKKVPAGIIKVLRTIPVEFENYKGPLEHRLL